VQDLVTIVGDNHGALVRLASTGTMAKVNGCQCKAFNQKRVRMELEVRLGRQNRPVIEMVEVD
jgi:hypothetical protein